MRPGGIGDGVGSRGSEAGSSSPLVKYEPGRMTSGLVLGLGGAFSLQEAPCSQVIVPPQPAPAPLIFPVPTWPTEPTLSVDLSGGCQGLREGLLFYTCRCSAAEPGALTGGQVCQH